MKAVFCGGHHTSALVVAEKLKERGDSIYWFGHKYSMIDDKNPSIEFLEVEKQKISFFDIRAGKFQKNFKFWQNIIRIPIGFFQSFFLLLRIKPDIIVSFGGYLAVPVALSGFIQGIPVVTHEQTVVSGVANKLIACLSKKIFISFKSSEKLFPANKVIYTGLPIRESIFKKGKPIFSNDKKTIYIMGGKQGSHVINEAVFSVIELLLKKYNVVHQCGSTSLFDDFKKAEKIREALGSPRDGYYVKEYFFEDEIGSVYNSADFVVSRAGAHTIYELILLRKPAILIPIPWSNRNEQEENAKMLKEIGLAAVITQEEIEKGGFLPAVENFSENLSLYKIKGEVEIPKDATEKIILNIDKILLPER